MAWATNLKSSMTCGSRRCPVVGLIALCLIVLLAGSAHSLAQEPMQELNAFGPFVASGKGVDKFTVPLKLGNVDPTRPIWLTFYNGFGGRPGFQWVRVLLIQPQLVETIGKGDPSGVLLADKDVFSMRNAYTVDMTGRLSDGDSLFIEAQGTKGAVFSVAVSALQAPTLSPLNPSETLSGRPIILHGTGFSTDLSENEVTFNGSPGKVTAATRTTLTVTPPAHVQSGNTTITVKVNGVSTSAIGMAVVPTPILSSLYPDGGPPGEILNIYGTNFAPQPEQNVVQIGPYPARVLGFGDKGCLRVEIPNWQASSEGLPVSVTSGGVPSRNSLTFYPYPHIFIRGSAF